MDLNKMLGTILLGSWLNVMLYMLEIIQVYKYFSHYSTDRLVFQIVVIVVFLVDTLCTIAECAGFYLYSVVHWGDFEYLNVSPWPFPVFLATSGITALIVQVFMLHRYWILTRRIILSIVIALLILASITGSLMIAGITARYPANSERHRSVIACYLWLISSAAADIVIAVALFIQFASSDNPYISKSLGRRLAALFLKTGSVTAMFALTSLIVYATDTQTNGVTSAGLTVCFCVGRIYSLTLLYNLNIRFSVRSDSTTLNVESFNMSDRSSRTDERPKTETTKISALTSISTQLYTSSSAHSGLRDEWGIRAPSPAMIVDEALGDVHTTHTVQKLGGQITPLSSTHSLSKPPTP